MDGWSGVEGFELLLPKKVVFGWGRRAELAELAKGLGRRAWIVCGSRTLQKNGVLDELVQQLDEVGIDSELLVTVRREPLVEDVDRVVAELLKQKPGERDFVLAVGGGSAVDLAKAVAALVVNADGRSVVDFLEGVGKGLKITRPPLPVLAVPTTAGTGSEATKNAVISNLDPPFKKSLRSEFMVPPLVLIDPELSVSVPPETTTYTGMDAVTQLVESYVSRRAKPVPQALAWKGLELALPAIERVVKNGEDREARERMALAAFLSGVALANSGLGLAHGVAAALGVHAGVPHGLACAVMLPVAVRVNLEVRLDEFAQMGTLLTGKQWSRDLPEHSKRELAETFLTCLTELCRRLNIPQRLSELGVKREQLPAVVQSSRGNSMSGNPRQLTDEELHELLEEML